MEADNRSTINSLKKKIQRIISGYELTASENVRLSSELEKCREEINISNNKIKDLEQKIENLQLIEAFKASTQDVKEAKYKINRLVKEIDKCIALLND